MRLTDGARLDTYTKSKGRNCTAPSECGPGITRIFRGIIRRHVGVLSDYGCSGMRPWDRALSDTRANAQAKWLVFEWKSHRCCYRPFKAQGPKQKPSISPCIKCLIPATPGAASAATQARNDHD